MFTRFSPRFPFMLASILLLAPLCVWPQEGDWHNRMNAGEKAFKAQKYPKAEQEFRAALAQAQTFPATDLRKAETLEKLAKVCASESNFAEAEDLLKRDASVTEAATGPDDPRLANVLIALALNDELDNKPDEAAPLWRRSVAILKNAAKPFDPGPLNDMEGVAMRLRAHLSNPTGEEHIYGAVLELRESLGASDRDLKSALHDMAWLYERTDRPSLAEPLMTRIVAMDEKDFGPDRPIISEDVEELAMIYTSEKKFDAAIPLLRRRLEINERNNRPDTPAARRRKHLELDLDYVLVAPEVPLVAATGGLVVLPIGIPINRPDAREVSRSYRELAKGYVNAAKYPEAEATYKQLIDFEGKAPDSDRKFALIDMELFDDWISLSTVYRNDRRYDDALEAVLHSETAGLQIANSKFEQQNSKQFGPPIYSWLSEIARAEIYREMGDTTAATAAFEKSLEMTNDLKNSSGHYKFAEMLDNYATLLRDEGKYDQSEALYKRSLGTWDRSRNRKAPEIAGTLMNYAALLRKLDRPSEADALEVWASAIPPKVPTIAPDN